jgi:hypothetical protein
MKIDITKQELDLLLDCLLGANILHKLINKMHNQKIDELYKKLIKLKEKEDN